MIGILSIICPFGFEDLPLIRYMASINKKKKTWKMQRMEVNQKV